MSHPPEYPGRQRLKRLSARAGSDAYQGAFEAVGAVLVACGIGFWVDSRWDTAPWGLLLGVVIGFAAMVLRLVRLGQELHPEEPEDVQDEEAKKLNNAELDRHDDDELGVAVEPGVSDVLRQDDEPFGRPASQTEQTKQLKNEK